jgi:acetyl esterase/lipase
MKTILSLAGLLCSLMFVSCVSALTPTPLPTQPPPTATPGAPGIPRARIPFLSFGTWQTDVTFCKDQAQPLLMDVYYPDEFKRNPAPVGVFLHELGGEKNGVDIDVVQELLTRGYIVAAVSWRQPPTYKMQVGIEDAKCAVRHLRANAATYRLDANRIGAWGCSVGGTLTALLGVTDASAGLEGKSGFPDQSSRVQAVVTRDGVYDWRTVLQASSDLVDFGFSSFDDPMIGQTSPLSHISKNAPPFLIFRSDLDTFIGPI